MRPEGVDTYSEWEQSALVPKYYRGLVVSDPLVSNLLRHSLDVLGRILGLCAAVSVEEVVAALGNEEALLIACGIAVGSNGNLLDESRGLGVIFLLADNLSHCINSFPTFNFFDFYSISHIFCLFNTFFKQIFGEFD